MGAVAFSLDQRLVAEMSRISPFETFVETGTYRGDTADAMREHVAEVFTIELSDVLYKQALERFVDIQSVTVIRGNSSEALSAVVTKLGDRRTLYWLDAHWCEADATSGQASQCPLLGELAAIGTLNEKSVVLIDDARLFLAPPVAPHEASQWPRFNEIMIALRALGPSHRVMVVNDVIAFYPDAMNEAFETYAREFGVDWLDASRALKENHSLRADLEAKERVIRELDTACRELERQSVAASAEGSAEPDDTGGALIEALRAEIARNGEEISRLRQDIRDLEELGSEEHFLLVTRPLHRELLEKERVIQQQERELSRRRNRRTLGARVRQLLQVRLGVLSQHPPCPIRLPDHYATPVPLTAVPRISIVTPSFNQGDFLGRTLDSVLDQTYPAIELFVQDGGSKDTSVDVLRAYEDRLSGWVSERDAGQSDAIDKGFARTSGAIMAWLNSDDLLLPGSLHYVAQFFNDHPEVDVVYGHRLLIDSDDRMIGRWIMPPHRDDILSWADYVPQETLFWRREIWDRAGGRIDTSFRFAMDWDLLLRFRDAGAKFARLPRFLGGFRIHEQQKTSALISEVGYAEMDRLRERSLGRVPQPGEVYKAVAPYLMRHVVSDFGWRLRNRLRGRQ